MSRKSRNLANVSIADKLTAAEEALIAIYKRSLGNPEAMGFDIRTICMKTLNRRPTNGDGA